jgi:aspartyl-tRNA(Asn)/glutamyl-tRNA(Gln) amidotransferase subunit B
LIELVASGDVSFTAASGKIFPALLETPLAAPRELAVKMDVLQESDSGPIEQIVNEVLEQYPDKVLEYRKGKKGLLALFVGQVMKRSGGKADPQMTSDILIEKLKT